MTNELYQEAGTGPEAAEELKITPERSVETGQPEEPVLEDMESSSKQNTEDDLGAAGEGDTVPFPCCPFYSCFAHEGGHCTALKNNEFMARPCPFYKSRAQMKKDQQDAFDRLLMEGRLDLINRYEEVLVALGIEDPEDAKVPVDDDILKAREELESYVGELEKEAAEGNPTESDDDEYDLEGMMAEVVEKAEEHADEEKDCGLQ